jgi:signal transduction histidine kinase
LLPFLLPFAIVAVLITQTPSPRTVLDVVGGIVLLAVGASIAWFAHGRELSQTATTTILVGLIAISLLIWVGWPRSQAWILLVGVVSSAGGRLPLRDALPFLIASVAIFLAVSVMQSTGRAFELTQLWALLLLVSVFVIGVQRRAQRAYMRQMEEMVVALREYGERLEEAHRQLQADALQSAALAAAEERNRIAREIHDVLAHSLTVIVVQAQAIKRLMRADLGAAEEQAEAMEQLAREGLQEARRSVSALRSQPADVDGVGTLRRLVEEFGRQTQTATSFGVVGAPVNLAPGAWAALYRVTQEALTNARRHGQARRIDVHLATDGTTRLVVEDDGSAAPTTSITSGNGLTGMRERIERLGGSLHYGPCDGGGFRVEAELPGE